jgi:site-specific recombinase XerC
MHNLSMETIVNFKTQAATFMSQIQTRRRNPVKRATVTAYQSYLNKWVLPLLGEQPLEKVENGVVKGFIAELSRAGLKPASITGILSVVKQVVSSAVDENGNELFTRKWNHDFLDVPVINQAEQDAPIVPANAIEKAVGSAKGSNRSLYALLAGSGLRIGEALTLMVGPDNGKNSYWDPENALVTIRTTLVDGQIQPSTKTEAGNRLVDLAPELNTFLCQQLLNGALPGAGLLFTSQNDTPVNPKTAYRHLRKAGISDGFHAFRRFRITHLESQNVPRGLQMFWTGHAAGSVHESYIKMGGKIEERKEWVRKAGLGFKLDAA